MIKYNLKCSNNHEFESWFSDSNEFERLNKKRLLNCIFCSSKKITKSIMSPRVLNSKEKIEINNSKDKEFRKFKDDLTKLRNFVEKNFEFVGDKFAKKVRDIYYDKNENQRIYGTTTPEEREELMEEGIELTSIPWVNKEN
ncbi:hypothetical protein JI56_02030 [SAR11 cluster bacterium PRT-SC02]|nr:hypothetical protein JI56_02030 [SAR11 cluster bacterium PRT-SC02]